MCRRTPTTTGGRRGSCPTVSSAFTTSSPTPPTAAARRTTCTCARGGPRGVIPAGPLSLPAVSPAPADGGRPPYDVYLRARGAGAFTDVETVGSLRVLRRVSGAAGEGVG